ncbi:hypothetical protein AAVH_20188, partial [Aphelenchoides avenae]
MSSKLMPKDLVDAVGGNVKPPTTRSRRQRRKDAVDTAPNAPGRETEAAVDALFDSDVEPAAPQALTVPSVKVDPQPQPGKREGRS